MTVEIKVGDALKVLRTMDDESVQCCITSPPYWGLRSYLPDHVKIKKGVPQPILDELKTLGVFPVDRIGG